MRGRAGSLERGKLGPPGDDLLEGVPKARLGRLLVEGVVDVRHVQRLDRRGEVLQVAEDSPHLARQRELHRVQEGDRLLAHDYDELRLHDVQLAPEPATRLLLVVGVPELEAVRPVDRQRVDVEPLQRLEDRLAGASKERHALLRLGLERPVLEQHDVRERVARSEDGDAELARCMADLVTELVDLGDGLLQVLLVDLVGGHGGHGGRVLFAPTGPFP
jgi:hypothetical protein